MTFSKNVFNGINIDFDDMLVGSLVGSRSLILTQKRLPQANDMVNLLFGHDVLTDTKKGEIIEKHLTDIKSDDYLIELILNNSSLMGGVVASDTVLEDFRDDAVVLEKIQKSEVAVNSIFSSSNATSKFLEGDRIFKIYWEGENYSFISNGCADSYLTLDFRVSDIRMDIADSEDRGRNIGVATEFKFPLDNINTIEFDWEVTASDFSYGRFSVAGERGLDSGEGDALIEFGNDASEVATRQLDVSALNGEYWVRCSAAHTRNFSSSVEVILKKVSIIG